jgi:serine/threonine protein kinase
MVSDRFLAGKDFLRSLKGECFEYSRGQTAVLAELRPQENRPVSSKNVLAGHENMGVCLTDEMVEQYVAGDCLPDMQQAVEAHLAQCESCQQRVESTRTSMDASTTANSANASEETEADQDEHPTESPSQVTSVPYTKPSAAQAAESMFEGYKIVEELPRGGQAVVYKAIHIATKTNVAIKVLPPTLLASQRARYYFEREAELIAKLDHPNIVAIRDSGIIQSQYYFVMHYIEGQPLLRYIRAHDLSFREKLLLFNKVCSVITYAHQQDIIHRDLKFANMLVDERGEPHILDFGLAKVTGLSESSSKNAVATMTGQWAGSLSTMSPEQAAGRPDLIDVRTDVYSLGVILYYILTGQYPYDVTGSTLQALQNIQTAEPVRPRQIIRKFDSDVEAILLTAMAKDPAQRYQSTAEMQSDVENWLDGRPIRVKSIRSLYLLRKTFARHRYQTLVAALVVVIVLAFTWAGSYLYRYRTTRRALNETEATAAQREMANVRLTATLKQYGFTSFLRAWEQDQKWGANVGYASLSTGSKEKRAAAFLLDPRPVAEKEPDFRRALSDEHTWFVDFIIGENHRKNDDKKEALAAYRRSYDAIQQLPQADLQGVDQWLTERVRDRLAQLTATDKQGQGDAIRRKE